MPHVVWTIFLSLPNHIYFDIHNLPSTCTLDAISVSILTIPMHLDSKKISKSKKRYKEYKNKTTWTLATLP
jgi:hypothetical protein